jgi:hypothetical protein
MDNTILDDTTDTIDELIEAPADTISRLQTELAAEKSLSERWRKRCEASRQENKAFAKVMAPVIQAAFYEMESSDVIDLLPLADLASEVAEKMDLDSIAEDVCHNYLDIDQLTEDVVGKICGGDGISDIISEAKADAVQEVANVLINALRSIG